MKICMFVLFAAFFLPSPIGFASQDETLALMEKRLTRIQANNERIDELNQEILEKSGTIGRVIRRS